MEIVIFVFIVIFVSFLLFAKFQKSLIVLEKEKVLPYYKIHTLLTPAELSFYHVLKLAVQERYDINTKVRLADLIAVNKRIDKANWGKAFNQIKAKHIDFVLCDKETTEICCAIELDDQSHQRNDRKNRDAFVDKACSAAYLPLVRFDARATYKSSEILTKIMSTIEPDTLTATETDDITIKILLEPE